jgi:hypothetical protein
MSEPKKITQSELDEILAEHELLKNIFKMFYTRVVYGFALQESLLSLPPKIGYEIGDTKCLLKIEQDTEYCCEDAKWLFKQCIIYEKKDSLEIVAQPQVNNVGVFRYCPHCGSKIEFIQKKIMILKQELIESDIKEYRYYTEEDHDYYMEET